MITVDTLCLVECDTECCADQSEVEITLINNSLILKLTRVNDYEIKEIKKVDF